MPEIKEKYKSLFAKYSLEQKKQLYEAMTDFFSENKRQLLDQNIQNRTKKEEYVRNFLRHTPL